MNAKKMRKKIARARRARMQRERAVSPVVATLILILVAVAAAAALYLWLVAWQGNVTGGIGQPTAQSTLYIGGSTSVFPWSQVAVKQFEQNQSDVTISVDQGGSGAGMAAVCSGQVQIGASSSPQTTLVTQYGCPSTVVQETVAYDAVDIVVQAGNNHALQSASWDTMQAIYVSGVGGTPVPVQTQTNLASAGHYTFDGVAATVTPTATGLLWDQIPACSEVGVACAYTANDILSSAGVLALAGAAGSVPLAAGVVVGGAAGDSPCGFNVCAGGAGSCRVRSGSGIRNRWKHGDRSDQCVAALRCRRNDPVVHRTAARRGYGSDRDDRLGRVRRLRPHGTAHRLRHRRGQDRIGQPRCDLRRRG